jgi:ribonuclease-3
MGNTEDISQIDNTTEQERAALEERIGYSFLDKNLLKRALVHKSRSIEERQQNKECEDQDALGTLGDAVLKAILCDLLIRSGYDTKGEISITKSKIENRPFLAQIGQEFNLSKAILPGKGARQQKHHEQPNVIAETLEAIIGAMYLDQGFDITMEVVSLWYEPHREHLMKN